MKNKNWRRARRLWLMDQLVDIAICALGIVMGISILFAIIMDICDGTNPTLDEPAIPEQTTQVETSKPEEMPIVSEIPESEPVEEPPTEVEATVIEGAEKAIELVYYDIPLDHDLQKHIIMISNYYNIEPSIVFAMIKRESRYRPDVIGDNGRSYGLMQIQERWHKDRMNKLGVTDLLDPYQNVLVGIDYLAELFKYNEDVEWVLMAYNGGMAYANRLIGSGTVSAYATGVLTAAREIRGNVA
jgi:hypothetical protein